MDGEAAAEPVGLLVDGPVLLGAEVVREPAAGEHRAGHPELLHRPSQLQGRFLGLLHGYQGEADESWAALHVGVVQPVVVRAAYRDGPVPVDDAPVRQPARREQRRAVDAHVVHEHQPLFDADLREGARRRHDRLSGVKVVDRREDAAEVAAPGSVQVLLRHAAGHRRDICDQVSVSINDLQPVCHDVRLLACMDVGIASPLTRVKAGLRRSCGGRNLAALVPRRSW